MFDKTEAITLNLMTLALNAASFRHKVIAHNIANANTPGFVPRTAIFQVQMARAQRTLAERGGLNAEQSLTLHAETGREKTYVTGGVANLDMQAAGLAKNSLHYQTLAKALNKHFSILSAAINEGKR